MVRPCPDFTIMSIWAQVDMSILTFTIHRLVVWAITSRSSQKKAESDLLICQEKKKKVKENLGQQLPSLPEVMEEVFDLWQIVF